MRTTLTVNGRLEVRKSGRPAWPIALAGEVPLMKRLTICGVLVAFSVVVAHDRQGCLGNSVAKHENHRKEVACDAKSCHAVLVKSSDKHIVARDDHTTDGGLGNKCREAQAEHVPAVACREV